MKLFPGSTHRCRLSYITAEYFGELYVSRDRVDLTPPGIHVNLWQLTDQQIRLFPSTRASANAITEYVAALQRWIGWPFALVHRTGNILGYLLRIEEFNIQGQDAPGIRVIFSDSPPQSADGDTPGRVPFSVTGSQVTAIYVVTTAGRRDSDGVTQLGWPNGMPARGVVQPEPRILDTEFRCTLHEANAAITDESDTVVLDAEEVVEGLIYAEENIMPILGPPETTRNPAGSINPGRNEIYLYDLEAQPIDTQGLEPDPASPPQSSFIIERARRINADQVELRLRNAL